MGVTYFLEILFAAVMLLISAVSVTAAVILLLVRVYKKRRDGQVKRVYTVLPAIFFTFAALCILPAVGIIGYTRSAASELDNHRSYGETLTQSADGSFRLGEDGYRLVNCCALSDSAVLDERIANLIPSDSLLARLYFNIMGVKGDPVYSVENDFGLDLLAVGEQLFCRESEYERLVELCGSYDAWGGFCIIGRNWDVPRTEVMLSNEVFSEIIEWRDSAHTPDDEPVYGDAVTLCAVSPNGRLYCKLTDLILTEEGEWMIQYIIWDGEPSFSTEPLPDRWADELSALNQIGGR